MSDLRIAVHRAARSFRGGIEALAAAMSTPNKRADGQILRNQLIGNERHHLGIDRAEEIVDLCDSDELAHAAARQRGGVFIKLPAPGMHDREEMRAKFNRLYAKIGKLSDTFEDAVEDEEIDAKERANLTHIAQEIHTAVEELVSLTFEIYCRPNDADGGREK